MKTQPLKTLIIGVSLLISAVSIGQQNNTETVTDFDGNIYKTVQIGDQVWMAENLRTTHYSDGSALESFPVNGDESNTQKHGRLYRWQAAIGGPNVSDPPTGPIQGASPEGWHIPSEEDWLELINHLGDESIAGGLLKEDMFQGTTSEIGFGALASGWLNFTGEYAGFGEKTFVRSSTSPNGHGGYARELNHVDSTFNRVFLHPDDAISIRCVQNK
jgi:uncharacterized protein (TIGR02145 family)